MKHLAVSLTKQGGRQAIVNSLLAYCTDKNIPILTIFLLPYSKKQDSLALQELRDIFSKFSYEALTKFQIKVSIIGKWYALPDNIVAPMKELMEETKEYDSFFLNFCINYDGQQEIVDACKLLAMQVQGEKILVDGINESVIKENIYNSYFIPPDLIVYTEGSNMNGFLLWDSNRAKVLFLPNFDVSMLG